jgi:glycosyltransferase involved in cell wall biosynthesis
LNILHIIPSVALCYGGPSQAINDMCCALQLAGCEVQVATTDANGNGHLAVKLEEVQIYQNVPTIFFKRQWSESFKYSHPLAHWLSKHVSDFGVVHIHAVFSHACLAAARACRNAQIPYIVRTIGNLDPWSLGQKSFRKKLFWHLAVKRMLHGAAAIHYTTRDEKRLAEQALGLQRGVVIPLGVDDQLLQADSGENLFLRKFPILKQSPYILTLCRLHPKKNLESLIEAFLKLTAQPEFQAWKLVIAGDGEADYVAQLKQAVKEYGGIDRVLLLTGYKAKKKSALCEARIYLHYLRIRKTLACPLWKQWLVEYQF